MVMGSGLMLAGGLWADGGQAGPGQTVARWSEELADSEQMVAGWMVGRVGRLWADSSRAYRRTLGRQ